MSGWIPTVVQIITVCAVLHTFAGRSRRWLLLTVPASAVLGVLSAVAAHGIMGNLGVVGEPVPWQLSVWIAMSGFAATVAVAGWAGTEWERRGRTVFAASFCLLSVGLTVNGWIGYSPTVYSAWNQLSNGRLPNETDWAAAAALRGDPMPANGVVVRVDITSASSGFDHREEFVYLPPAWFVSDPPPTLPAVMMIGGQFNDPADWLRAADAIGTLDAFAAAHRGSAPVAVFVDHNGSFANDTECVNGTRGMAEDHLTLDVVPQVTARFGVSEAEGGWGVAGFSAGGTCAVSLAVRHPETFGSFVDIAGDRGPNAGTKAQTVDRLFGGDEKAWDAFDPATVMTRHGDYIDSAGMFVVPQHSAADSASATELCDVGRANRVTCTVTRLPGRHVWPFAGSAFMHALPWLAGRLGVPDASEYRLPS